MVAKDKEGRILLMYTKWQEEAFSSQDLEQSLHYLMKAGVNPDCYFLFSKADFTQGLRQKTEYVNNIHLVDLKEL